MSSWFLDEETVQAANSEDGELPKVWRLGSKPNLPQMHDDACERIQDDIVEATTLEQIRKHKNLTFGASTLGARVHNLQDRPREIENDTKFHYAMLGPKASSLPSVPNDEAIRFLNETTGPDNPRVYRNAVVLAVPSVDGIEVLRNRAREFLGWEEVKNMLYKQDVDPLRLDMLAVNLAKAKGRMPEAVQQAYSIVVLVDEENNVAALKVSVSDDPLFTTIKNDERARIQDTAITAEALLPDGPYDLWQEGETARRAQHLITTFAQFPRLPKMLNTAAIYDTLRNGCEDGIFVLRSNRPDHTQKTYWKYVPSDLSLDDQFLDVVLPDAVELTDLPAGLLKEDALPGLWQDGQFTFGALKEHCSGNHVAHIEREGCEEPFFVPKAEPASLDEAVKYAVDNGTLWLTSGPASIFREPVPAGVLNDQAILQPSPEPVPIINVLPELLESAWQDEKTTPLAISTALSALQDKNRPWPVVRDAIERAIRASYLEVVPGSVEWSSDFATASKVQLQVRSDSPPVVIKESNTLSAQSEVSALEIQDLADVIGKLMETAVGYDLALRLQITLSGSERPPDELIKRVNEILVDVSSALVIE